MILENGSTYYIIKDYKPIKFKLIVQAPNNPPVFIKPPISEITFDVSKQQNQSLSFDLPMINDIDSNDIVTVSLEQPYPDFVSLS